MSISVNSTPINICRIDEMLRARISLLRSTTYMSCYFPKILTNKQINMSSFEIFRSLWSIGGILFYLNYGASEFVNNFAFRWSCYLFSYIIYLFAFKEMKLVLKHKDSIKLYSLEMDYDTLVHFICKEFMIRPDTLELSFLDEEEDNISILSNDDIEVMTSLFEGKDYVKVQVLGEV